MKTLEIACRLEYSAVDNADFIFNLQAAHHPWQTIRQESFQVEPPAQPTFGLDHTGNNRMAKLQAGPGKVVVTYDAVVDVEYPVPTGQEQEMAIADLPVEVIPYIWASRYCESDALLQMAMRTFGKLPRGYPRVAAICDWIRDNITYLVGASTCTTSTKDVLVNRAGICRDFAHVGISFCRALNIPARFVTGYTWYERPPTDFHAVFEAYLGGRWILFDPTDLAPVTDLVRISTGRDAADAAFSTIFGTVVMTHMDPAVKVIAPAAAALVD